MSSVKHGLNLGENVNHMNKYKIKAFTLHTHRDEYKTRIQNVKQVIKECFKRYDNPAISYSGGKDSIVLTHITLSLYPDTPVWHWDYGDSLMPRQYEEEVINNLRSLTNNIIINKRKSGDKGGDSNYGYRQFYKCIAENKKKYGLDCQLVGVRQEESNKRKQHYKKYFMEGNCYPLLKLTYMDIWGYIVTHNLKYPQIYDLRGEYDGWDKVRFVTFFDKEFGTLAISDGVFLPEYRYIMEL